MTLEETSSEKDRTDDENLDIPKGEPAPENIDIDPNTAISDEKCAELRLLKKDGGTYMELSEDFGLEAWDVVSHIRGNCDCEVDEEEMESDKPWTEKKLVQELFIEQNYHFTEIAKLFDCHHETVKNWARDHHQITIVDDATRTSSKTVRKLQRIGIQNQENLDLPPEARKSPFGNNEDD